MPDLPEHELSSPEPRRQRRVPTLRRRLFNSALGAASGGVAGWLTTLLAGVDGIWPTWIIAVLAVLGAVFGYRYGRSVVVATFKALNEAAE